jgi:hypothetical protein
VVSLAANPVIQTELKATEKQKAALKTLSEKYDAQNREIRDQMGFGRGGPGGGPGGGPNGQNNQNNQNDPNAQNGAPRKKGNRGGQGGGGQGGGFSGGGGQGGGFNGDQGGGFNGGQGGGQGGGFNGGQGGGFNGGQGGGFNGGQGGAFPQDQQGGFGNFGQNQGGGFGNFGPNQGGPRGKGQRQMDPQQAEQFAMMRETMDQLRASGEQAVAKILDKGQFARLKQIQLQLRGPGAVFQPDMIEKLNITDEQVVQFQEIRDEQRQMQRDLQKTQRQFFQAQLQAIDPTLADQNGGNGGFGGNQNPGGNGARGKNRRRIDPEVMKKAMESPEYQAQMDENRAQQQKLENMYMAAVNKVLYPRQRTALKKMVGAPFDKSKLGGGPGNRNNPNAAAKNTPTSNSDDDEEKPAAASKPAAKTPAAKPSATKRKSLRDLRGSSTGSDQ